MLNENVRQVLLNRTEELKDLISRRTEILAELNELMRDTVKEVPPGDFEVEGDLEELIMDAADAGEVSTYGFHRGAYNTFWVPSTEYC